MAAPRFFTAADVTAGTSLALDPADAHHASDVLRCKAGEQLTLLSSAVAWDAEFESVGKPGVVARVLRRASDQGGELPAQVIVLQALTKGAKFDDVVEKTVELGAARIVPVACARSESQGGAHKLERWRRVARAAAMQSRRRVPPIVEPALSWKDALARFSPGALTLVAFENAAVGTFSRAIESYRPGDTVVVAIGPEGGFQADEVESARAHGGQLVSLGPTILRTETAAAALIAAFASSAGWW